MADENPRWGHMRIKGELQKLRIRVAANTIKAILLRAGLGPGSRRGSSWSEFLRAQVACIAASRSIGSSAKVRVRGSP